MSLEKNIERIADALELIAKTKGTRELPETKNTAGSRNPVQPPGQQAPQGCKPGQWAPQGNGQPPLPPIPGDGPVPVSLPADTGMPWQGGTDSTGMPGNLPPLQYGNPAGQQPGIQPPPLPGAGPVPTTATAQPYTFDQLAVATANLSSSGKDVFQILDRFGIRMLLDLPPERYGEFATALREAGAVI